MDAQTTTATTTHRPWAVVGFGVATWRGISYPGRKRAFHTQDNVFLRCAPSIYGVPFAFLVPGTSIRGCARAGPPGAHPGPSWWDLGAVEHGPGPGPSRPSRNNVARKKVAQNNTMTTLYNCCLNATPVAYMRHQIVWGSLHDFFKYYGGFEKFFHPTGKNLKWDSSIGMQTHIFGCKNGRRGGYRLKKTEDARRGRMQKKGRRADLGRPKRRARRWTYV